MTASPQCLLGINRVRETDMLAETFDLATYGRPMGLRKNIALIAHDNRKRDLVEWARFNRDLLAAHHLSATGTTGSLLSRELGLDISRVRSGPLGGDQQVGARIAEGDLDLLIFFWDPLEPHPHDVDVKALLRIAAVYNIPVACNRASADFIISSPLLGQPYRRQVADHELPENPETTGPGGRAGGAEAGLDGDPAV